MNGVLKYAKELFFPPRCIGCGTRLLPSAEEGKNVAFCTPCAAEFEKSMLSQCPECFAALTECRCQPHILLRAGSVAHVKLVPYDNSERHRVAARIIRSMKRIPRGRATSHLARLLGERVCSLVKELDEKTAISHTVIAFLPRARKRVREFGFDQAKELAKALSLETGYPAVTLLRRVQDGKLQKTLSRSERRENIKGCFAVCGEVGAKRVLLVDDLVTTGAGMAEATRLLRKAGAAQVVCVSVATTFQKSADLKK